MVDWFEFISCFVCNLAHVPASDAEGVSSPIGKRFANGTPSYLSAANHHSKLWKVFGLRSVDLKHNQEKT